MTTNLTREQAKALTTRQNRTCNRAHTQQVPT